MDPITTAIITAVSAGIIGGVTKAGEQVLVDAYNGLKDLLKKRLGARSKVVKAVKELEANPKSTARKEVLKEEIAAAKADQDTELLKAAQVLLETLKASQQDLHTYQTIDGNQNVQAAGNNVSITMNANHPKH